MGKDADEKRRQDKIMFGVYVPAITKANCYLVIYRETESRSWSALSIENRAKVLKALKKETGIAPDHNKAVVEPSPKTPIPDAPVDSRMSDEQKITINKVRNFLGWTEKGLDGFCKERFQQKPVVWLDGREAHSLLYLLLKIAAKKLAARNKDIKKKEYEWIDDVKDCLVIHSYRKTAQAK